MVDEASVSWVDFVAVDLHKEAESIASTMGFSKQLVRSLLNNKRGSYVDNDSELGILIPAVIVNHFDVKVNPLLILIKTISSSLCTEPKSGDFSI